MIEVQRLIHKVLCSWGRHSMVLYSVGHNYGRECTWCSRPGLLSKDDLDTIAQMNQELHGTSAPIEDDNDWWTK